MRGRLRRLQGWKLLCCFRELNGIRLLLLNDGLHRFVHGEVLDSLVEPGLLGGWSRRRLGLEEEIGSCSGLLGNVNRG